MSKDHVEVYRFRPENNNYSKPEIVATFIPHKKSAIHSFAITENYAVFFFPPMTYQTELGCLIPNRFHVLECMAYLKDEPTDVYVVNLKNGKVHEIQVQ